MEQNINILNELVALDASFLKAVDSKNYYSLPEGYFNDLPSVIISRIKVESIPVANLYSVPLNYFENLPELILDKTRVGVVVNSSEKELFFVPENYFDSLSANIIQRIKTRNYSIHQELEEISPLLNSIPKSTLYSTPDGYFESLVPKIPLQAKPDTKVIPLNLKTRKWINYAAAACVAAALGIGSYFYMSNFASVNNSNLAQANSENLNKEISQLSDNAINVYLTNDKSDIYTQAEDNTQNIDVQMLLDNTSDEEIENYLIENSDPGEKSKGI